MELFPSKPTAPLKPSRRLGWTELETGVRGGRVGVGGRKEDEEQVCGRLSRCPPHDAGGVQVPAAPGAIQSPCHHLPRWGT